MSIWLTPARCNLRLLLDVHSPLAWVRLVDPDLPPGVPDADVRGGGVGRWLGAARWDRPTADLGLRADVYGRREDPHAGLARRAARALVGRDTTIAGLGAEAVGLRFHRVRLCAGCDVRPVAGPCPAACLASAWTAVDRPVRDAPCSEPRLHVGQCVGAAWGAHAGDCRGNVRLLMINDVDVAR